MRGFESRRDLFENSSRMENMNITELARKLKIPTKNLLEMLPEMGFDIGKKAIKIHDTVAHRIIKDWPMLYAKYQKEKEKEEAAEKTQEEKQPEKQKIRIPQFITVREFSQKSGIPITRILSELMKNGILSSMNEKIDFDTAAIVGADLGIEVELDSKQEEQHAADQDLPKIISEEDKPHLSPRPPIIVIMGHVDHGKTKLLDTIRKSNVVERESGGITQHIGAYQITKNGKKITFIDTPGHEAFTTMRSRGAKVADIAILVIAADDGIKPQTLESVKIIKSAKLPMIVAINKIDKPEANVERVKQELAQINLLPEDWGGEILCIPISAKKGIGIDDLLDAILLVTEMEKSSIVANPNRHAVGTIIESHKDTGEGPVATALIQNGTLHLGDLLFIQGIYYGKVKNLKNFLGENVSSAPPSTPVKILGFKAIPAVGDILEVKNSIDKKSKLKNYQLKTQAAAVYNIQKKKKDSDEAQTLNLILRTDVLGSLEAIFALLDKLDHPDIHIQIISKGVGQVSESDVLLAERNNAVILAFYTTPTPAAAALAQEKNVEIRTYTVIYKLIDDVKSLLNTRLAPKVEKILLGKIQVLKVFRKTEKGMILGGVVKEGNISSGANVEVLREDVPIAKGSLAQLQRNKIVVQEVTKGNECGIEYHGKPIVQEGDILEAYHEKEEKQEIS